VHDAADSVDVSDGFRSSVTGSAFAPSTVYSSSATRLVEHQLNFASDKGSDRD